MKKLWQIIKAIGGLFWFLGLALGMAWMALTWRRSKDAAEAGEEARKEKADELEKKTPAEIVDSLPHADAVRDVLERAVDDGGTADAGAPAASAEGPRPPLWRRGSIFPRG